MKIMILQERKGFMMETRNNKLLRALLVSFISIGFLAVITAAEDSGKELAFVARKDYDVNKNWQPRKIMGKDYWHILGVSQDTHPKGNWANTHMKELINKPLFKESGLNYSCIKNITVPDSDKVAVAAMDAPKYLELIEASPNVPFFIMPHGIRPIYKLMKSFDCDTENYKAWKNSHPNFIGCIDGETDNDFLSAAPWRDYWWPKFKKNCTDKTLIDTIEKEFPKPANRVELTVQYLKACKGFQKFFFNDQAKANYMRAAHCHDHYFYEAGGEMAWLETTNTASPDGKLNYRHQVSLFFTRGAARQYNKNWGWYIAVFYNGYDDKGKFSGNNTPNYRSGKETTSDAGGVDGPGCGMSSSLLNRDMYLAYLNGASFVQHESWWSYLHTNEQKTWDLSSPFGKIWEDCFEFTRKNPDRGISYAPVALLVPFDQGYPNYGGKAWQQFNYERTDWMIDAFMFTIMPHTPVTKAGDEGALANSPYGDIYDVIVPDTPAKPVGTEILNNYKVAVMLGKYKDDKALSERLMEYVRNGGTLLLNIKQVNEFFPVDFLGFEKKNNTANSSMKVKSPVRSMIDGKTFALAEDYGFEAVRLNGAVSLLEDASGNVLASKNKYGKGFLMVAFVDGMVPQNDMSYQKWDVLNKLVYDKKFPFVEYFLSGIVREALPLEVKGDIEYGLNKVSDGWWLYLINNKGVTKFTNKEQVLDPSKTAEVKVWLKDMKVSAITELRENKKIERDEKINAFSINVPPGEVRIVKIQENTK